MNDISTYMAGELAKKMAEEKDNILRACIRNRVGPDVRIKDVLITGRITRGTATDEKSEMWCLDSQPLVEIWEPEVKTEDGRMTVSIAYRVAFSPELKKIAEQMKNEGISNEQTHQS